MLATGEVLTLDDLPREVAARSERSKLALPDGDLDLVKFLEEVEREILVRALHRTGGVKAHTAASLGLERNALRYKLKKYGLE